MIVLQRGEMLLNLCRWNFLVDFRKHLSFQFFLTLRRSGLDFFQKRKTSNRGRYITRPDPLDDVALISVATTSVNVVISGASTPTVSVGANRNHVHDSSAMWTLLAHLSYLLGFNIVNSCFFIGIPCLQTRTVSPWYDSCHHSD